jgi:hypothetical protein
MRQNRTWNYLILRLLASPQYRTAIREANSPSSNSKGKFSGPYAGYVLQIRCSPPPPPLRLWKTKSLSAQTLSWRNTVSTSSRDGQLWLRSSTPGSVRATFLMLFSVSYEFLGLGCVLPASIQLFALRDTECFARIFPASCMFSSRRDWTSPSACRCSFVWKRDIALRLIAFRLLLCASVSSCVSFT